MDNRKPKPTNERPESSCPPRSAPATNPAHDRWESPKRQPDDAPRTGKEASDQEVDKAVKDTFPASDPVSLQHEEPPEVGQKGSTIARAKTMKPSDIPAPEDKAKKPGTTGLPIDKTKSDVPREREDGGGVGG